MSYKICCNATKFNKIKHLLDLSIALSSYSKKAKYHEIF